MTTGVSLATRKSLFHLRYAPPFRAGVRIDVSNFHIDKLTNHLRRAFKFTNLYHWYGQTVPMFYARAFHPQNVLCRAEHTAVPCHRLLIDTLFAEYTDAASLPVRHQPYRQPAFRRAEKIKL